MVDFPLLKFAAKIACERDKLKITYRNKTYDFNVEDDAKLYGEALQHCNGHNSIKDIIKLVKISEKYFQEIISKLATIPIILNGTEIIRKDRYLSGRELFWRLEDLLFKWRYTEKLSCFNLDLEKDIAMGKAPKSVVKGFCMELGHLLRNVPEELSLAVANAQSEEVRSLLMDFYDEESRHGDILFEALTSWFDNGEQIQFAAPLPATVGLLQTYKAWAQKDSLLYATALMRDESSPLDADIEPEKNIYLGMKKYYDVPPIVVRKYEWHANLDRQNDHGFFPEKIFSLFPIIDKVRARNIISSLRQIIDLHDLFRWNIYSYYQNNEVYDRIELYKNLENSEISYC
jgi:hypothetical protein